MAISCEKFLKEKYPEIHKEFKDRQAADKKAEKEKEEQRLEKQRKTRHFWEFEFGYDVEFSYKGFTDNTDTEYLTFEEAWRVISKKELMEEYDIIPYTDLLAQDLPTEPGLSFKEYLEETGLAEDEVKQTLSDMLYDSPSYALQKEAESSWDWDAKVVSDVEWDGKYVFPKKHFDLVWKDFKKCRFMKTPEKEK